MKIPLGDFGNTVAQAVAPADRSGLFATARSVVQHIMSVEDELAEKRRTQEDALRRAKATSALDDYELGAQDVTDSIRKRVQAGELDEEKARSAFEKEIRGLPAPKVEGLDPAMAETVNHSVGWKQRKAQIELEKFFDAHRSDAILAETASMLASMGREASNPGADIAAIHERARARKPFLLAAGMDSARADQTLAEWELKNWRNQAERRLIDARDSIADLKQVAEDLGSGKGFYADKLDGDSRNELLRRAAVREDQLHDEARRAAEAAQKDADQDAQRLAIENVLLDGGRLDWRESDHRKFVDAAFDSYAREMGLNEPVTAGSLLEVPVAKAQRAENITQLGIQVAQRTGIVPRQFESFIRTGAHSPSLPVAARAVDAYARLKIAAPELAEQVDQDTKAFAEIATGMIDAGTDPAKAVEVARAQTFDAKPEVLEQRKVKWREVVKNQAGALSNLIDRDFDPGLFATEPGATERLKGDFDAQAERYFLKVGDADKARELAWADIRRVYGETRVNGEPVVALFPVERFGVTPEEVRTSIAEALAQHPAGDGSTADEIIVVPDSKTIRQVGDTLSGQPVSPSYSLYTKSGELWRTSDGQAIRYTLPSGAELSARLKAEQEAERQRALSHTEEARQSRESLKHALEATQSAATNYVPL